MKLTRKQLKKFIQLVLKESREGGIDLSKEIPDAAPEDFPTTYQSTFKPTGESPHKSFIDWCLERKRKQFNIFSEPDRRRRCNASLERFNRLKKSARDHMGYYNFQPRIYELVRLALAAWMQDHCDWGLYYVMENYEACEAAHSDPRDSSPDQMKRYERFKSLEKMYHDEHVLGYNPELAGDEE